MKKVTVELLEKFGAYQNELEYFVELDQEYSNPIKLCKKLKDDGKIEYLSWFSYFYCLDVEDIKDIRKYITIPGWAYLYCLKVKDRPEVRRYI